MITLEDHHIVIWLERGVLFLLAFYLCVHTMPRAWGKLNTDFPNYYMSARLAHEGYDTARMNMSGSGCNARKIIAPSISRVIGTAADHALFNARDVAADRASTACG